jgi:1,4-alpha-glucan branching enzyme
MRVRRIALLVAVFVSLALLPSLPLWAQPATSPSDNSTTQPAQSIEIRFRVKVPANTPPDAKVYLAGDDDALGSWKSDGVMMDKGADGVYTATIAVPAGSKIEYKVNRGTWKTVEKAADGSEIDNRQLTADQSQTVDVTVIAWADLPAPK